MSDSDYYGHNRHGASLVRRTPWPASVSTPVATPLSPSVVYASLDADALDDQYEGRHQGYTYAREGHPNATVLGQKIDQLEGVTAKMGAGIITSSGMAAVSALFLGLLEAGDHIVAGDQLYGRSLRLLSQDLPRLGFSASFADPTDASAFEAAIQPQTKMILVEVVSNPTLRVADMVAITRMAQKHNLLLVVDNTFTTPAAFQPFQQGANVVIHSITKLLAGHSDVTLGYIAADTPERNRALYDAAVTWGLTPSPFDCWLAERGIYTFELRYQRAQANAVELADFLATLDGVERVLYPGRHDHPDYGRARTLLNGQNANMVSFCLKGGRAQINAFLQAAERIPFAPTLGDVATTLSHPASSSHRGLTAEKRLSLGIPEGFIRLSVGIEDCALLKSELAYAIQSAMGGVK